MALAALETVRPAAGPLARPGELLPGLPDAVVDLQTADGAKLAGARWRYADAHVDEIDFVEVADHLGPGDVANRTYDVVPHAEGAGFEDSDWRVLAPEETQLRLSTGRVCFNWYRTSVTLPDRIGQTDSAGATIVFEVVVDDYAEVWVDGELPIALGDTSGRVAGGFNAPNRVVLTRDARPGQTFQIAVFGINGPISASPQNYIWMRSATLDVYAAGRVPEAFPASMVVDPASPELEAIVPEDAQLQRVAGGFEFTEGPVWTADGALLFSSPNTNVIYRWSPEIGITVFRSKSGYTGTDIGRYHQTGSNGLTFDSDGRLTICQHGNRRIIRVEAHGNITVLADAFEGGRLNSPKDLFYRSDDTLYFTAPPFGLPAVYDDPAKELSFSGVFSVRDGEVRLETDELAGPNGLAFPPDERCDYVGDWDLDHKVVMPYDVAADGSL